MGASCCGEKKAETSPGMPQGSGGASGGQPGALGPEADEHAPVPGDQGMKIAVEGGGGKSGRVQVMPEAVLINAPNEADAVLARKSHKKDKSGQDFDGRRKEYVYEYLNKEGGYLLDPADKQNVIKVEPGTL